MRGCGLCAPRSLFGQAAWRSARVGSRGRRLAPRGGGFLGLPWSPSPAAPAAASLLFWAWGQPPFFLSPGRWRSPPCAPGSRGPQLGPHPQRDPTSLLRGPSAHLPSPAARLRSAPPKPPLVTPFPKGPWGASCLPWGGLPRAGGRLKARPPLHSRVPQSGCSQGTHAGGGRKPLAAPPSVQALAARAQLPAPSVVPSACISPRGWQARRDLPDPVALTSLLSSSSRERPPAAVPAGPTTRRGTGSRRPEPAARLPGLDRARGRRGCRRSRRAAAERAAAGTVYKLPALAGPRAARPHTARTRQKHSSGA